MTVRLRQGSSALLIDTDGRFLLQQRDDLPSVSDPGKISLFGGRRENGENFLECVVREIHEEVGYYVGPERFELLGSYKGPDPHVPNGTLHGEVFVVRGVPVECLTITEGSLKIIGPTELDNVEPLLSPSAKYALSLFFKLV